MLKSLHIQNYALIDRLDIDFGPGFSVVTGETGAGKSIILGALGLLLGQRADSKSIKPGANKCSVEATFDISGMSLHPLFEENDLDYDETTCIIRREVLTGGKSRSFVNDTPVNLQLLRTLSSRLVDIHSQHKNLLINQEGFLLDTLDAVAGNAGLLTQYAERYDTYNRLKQEIAELDRSIRAAREEEDYLNFQARQIADANLCDTEQEDLENEQRVLGHAEEIKNSFYQVAELLQGGETNLLNQLKTCAQLLQGQSEVFADAGALAERMHSAFIEVSDICNEVEHHAERIEFDPERLAYVDDRLGLIYSLEQKHNVSTVDELIGIGEELNRRLQTLNTGSEQLAGLQARLPETEKRLLRAGDALTAGRRDAARRLTSDLTHRLADLGMPNVRLDFAFERKASPAANGLDTIRLLFSANKSMPMQDVSDIASGGETARLMLALKASVARYTSLPTVIFDEIDTGVSGRMAEKMAMTMKEMAAEGQIISITHLPQIAALGTAHYRVFKQEEDNVTTSHIVRLTTDERIEEIAHMLSGEVLTDAAVDNAKALLTSHQA